MHLMQVVRSDGVGEEVRDSVTGVGEDDRDTGCGIEAEGRVTRGLGWRRRRH
jgi:hypothetical protein